MLVVKSRHSFRSTGPDRLATARSAQLPGLAKAKGWDFALLADERSMAGALDFLEAARTAGLRAAAGLQVTGLVWRSYDLGMVLMPLRQTGLRRLTARADAIGGAEKIGAVLRALRDGAGPSIDVTAFLMPGRDAASASEAELAELRAAFLEAKTGPVAALVEGGPDRAEMHHAPWETASRLHERGGVALARLTMGYAPEDLSREFQDGLVALATDNADKNAARAARLRPRMPTRIGIPSRDTQAEQEPPAAVATSIESRVEPMSLVSKPTLPARLGLNKGEDAGTRMKTLARSGLAARIAKGRITSPAEAKDRLEHELEIIAGLGFANYFLIVREAVEFARSAGIPVGPGRGSVAGSMAAYALGITDIDPIRHKLLFERFINPERVSLPDIDTDLCEDRRHEVIAHMAEIYGDEHVAHISTYASNKPRGAVRSAGRILNESAAATRVIGLIEERLGKVRMLEEDELNARTAKVIEELAATETEPQIRSVAMLAATFLGIAANQGVHAGGVVLSDEPIRERVPLHAERTEHGRLAVQTDMHATEACGLVKFDFLGLTTLSTIRDCQDMLAAHGVTADLDDQRMDDATVFEMLRAGRTKTVFQLERGGISQAAREIGVDSFEDIVALVALYRPGPMAHIPTYAARKKGLASVSYLDATMENALRDTYGLIVYQEQVMAIARSFAGYSLAEADILRKAIGKKNAKLLESQHEAFVEKAMLAGQPRELAEEVFAFIVPFAEYGFNRSHAAAYATLTYHTAWLKCRFAPEWYAACATRKTKPEERARLVADAEHSGVRIVLPDVNLSKKDFSTIRPQGEAPGMVLPLRVVNGARSDSVAAILAARDAHGPFRSFLHLVSLTDASADATIKALVDVGACDSLTTLPATIARPHFTQLLQQPRHRTEKVRSVGQTDLLAGAAKPLDLTDPAPMLWPQHPDGVRALSPEDAVATQERLLKGMIDHQGGQMKATEWLRDVEGLVDLSTAERMAAKAPIRTLAILVAVDEREQPGANGLRVLQATVEDDGGRRVFDLAVGADIHPEIPGSKGRVVRLLMQPSPHEAFIADRPVISSITLCDNPLTQRPPPYPLIHLEDELTDSLREELRNAILGAGRQLRQRRRLTSPGQPDDAAKTAASHALLVPPSRAIEALELTDAVRRLGPATVFGALDQVLEVVS